MCVFLISSRFLITCPHTTTVHVLILLYVCPHAAGRMEDVCKCPKSTHFNFNKDQLAKIFRLVGTPTSQVFTTQHTFCQCCIKKSSALSAHPPARSLQHTCCLSMLYKDLPAFAKTDSGNKIPDTGVPQQDALPATLRVLGYVHSATRSSRHQRRHLPPSCAVQHFHHHH